MAAAAGRRSGHGPASDWGSLASGGTGFASVQRKHWQSQCHPVDPDEATLYGGSNPPCGDFAASALSAVVLILILILRILSGIVRCASRCRRAGPRGGDARCPAGYGGRPAGCRCPADGAHPRWSSSARWPTRWCGRPSAPVGRRWPGLGAGPEFRVPAFRLDLAHFVLGLTNCSRRSVLMRSNRIAPPPARQRARSARRA